ncbi:MAG: glycogen/starch synthase [Saprospiraceae bacterium]|nr:glycogen/starch synthase [Saprospiraceae bacterium]
MEKKRVLIVTQEMEPYTALSEISKIARKLPQHIQENGMEIRVLMPRFGTINERRHRLHEVVRLSGMNIIVDDDDYPLIIKVASLPGARMQVYFLDNEDFFKRKSVFEDDKGKPFKDNQDRMIFFCKGVLETVKKFGWAPDIVSCHGWMTSLIPMYLKAAYKNEPIFKNSRVVYSMYTTEMDSNFDNSMIEKASINNLEPEDLSAYLDNDKVALHKGACEFADAVIIGSETLNDKESKVIESCKVPVLEAQTEEAYLAAYLEFFQAQLEEEVQS